jgi:predicted MFS family arabinose efflux permease
LSRIDRRWIILICLFLSRTAMGFQFQVIGSASDQMSGNLGLSYTEIGTLIGFFILPGLVLAFPAGWLGRWFQDKVSTAAGLIFMAAGGVLAANADGFYGIAAGRLLMGVGFVVCSVYFTKMVVDWFSGHELDGRGLWLAIRDLEHRGRLHVLHRAGPARLPPANRAPWLRRLSAG